MRRRVANFGVVDGDGVVCGEGGRGAALGRDRHASWKLRVYQERVGVVDRVGVGIVALLFRRAASAETGRETDRQMTN